ncbi:MAG: UDP-N-acetylmuramoylalanyl-D-glutamyl-2,6-diaminopimelate/D-alanyl-D-alanyl ligase [Sphingobacteriaceae bacterium]|jgi:UDP-N-acetylmuramoyl-tripeptide--D-alanyl-D-alanine ligase|nr:UDP-N-acetylmuramoylalanyl-D-glutamyl-2,6-diaminopimelate/D-alanyl-D-alanyl ligase [Sphingobacteriaceae bacterium]
MNTEQLYEIYLDHPTICTDTRKISAGCIFFALKGENFDANTFAAKALELGAAYAVIDAAGYRDDDRYILVDDVLVALQDLARHHRRQQQIPFIGITGSNGKTTSKELINSVLSQRFKTFATEGNLNNHIGVPLTILSISSDIEMAIVEMGANHQKEIEFLCSISQPTHGLITNVGKAHLEGFGGFEGVKIGKGELYQYLAQNTGTAFINRDNHDLMSMSRKAGVEKMVCYGQGADCYVNGRLVSSDPFLTVSWKRELTEFDNNPQIANSHLTGTYNLENLLAAIAIGIFFGLTTLEVNAGIDAYHPTNNRSQIVKTSNNTLVCDYYNANPSSMAVALDNLHSMQGDNKAFILGDMFELGEESAEEHKAVLEKAMEVGAYRRIFIGKEFSKSSSIIDAEFYSDTQLAAEALGKNPIKDAVVLVKGSRGMKLETLTELL